MDRISYTKQLISILENEYELNEGIKNLLLENSFVKVIEPNQIITDEGDSCSYFTFVIKGTVRVFKLGESGKEITLYRIEEGESCILTASCILAYKHFPAISVTESEVTALLIPSGVFIEWVEKYKFWRDYVYDLMAKRISSVISIVEEVAFKRVDQRLIEYLYNRSKESKTLMVTHSQIAAEFGTAREVVSRLLKDLERKNLLELSRGKITIISPENILNEL